MSIRSAYNSDLTLRNLTLTGDLTITQPIDLNDVTMDSLHVTGATQCDGNVNVGQQLNVTGPIDASGALNVVSDFTTLKALTVNETALVTGDTNFGGKMFVAGSSQFASDVTVAGNFSATMSGTTLKGLTVNETAQVAGDTTLSNATVTSDLTVQGNLTVNGLINGQSTNQTSLEIQYFQLTGNATSVSDTINLSNGNGTTNYAVFPSVYYGYGGSGGTYNLNDSCATMANEIIISNRTAGSFNFNVNKSNGDNTNVYLLFLIVYSPQANYPVSY